tara:strand:- start:64 stop:756 length:693 start_codon:yes stop_codon:yes gene_type:complete
MNKRENENWLWIKERLGNKCARCGCTVNLQIDHIDPRTKKFEVKSRLSYKRINLIEEVDKCQLLCKPCHKDKTYNEDWDLIVEKKKEFFHVEHNFYPLLQQTMTDITIDLDKKDGAAYYRYVKLIAKRDNKTIEEVIKNHHEEADECNYYSFLQDWDSVKWKESTTEKSIAELKEYLEEHFEKMKNENPRLYEICCLTYKSVCEYKERPKDKRSMTKIVDDMYRIYDESN